MVASEMEAVAFGLGAVLSLVLQILKRWYTFTPSAIKGGVILIAILYAIAVELYKGTFNAWAFVLSLGSFIGGNQALFALILNNTDVGTKLAGEIKDDY